MTGHAELWNKISSQPYCDPERRMDFVVLFDVRDGNPNGDPDAGNLPRMDPSDRHGIVTDVCVKRKIRDYLASVLERPIYIQSKDALNTLYFRAASEVSEAKKHVVEIDLAGEKLKQILSFTRNNAKVDPSDDQMDAVLEWLTNLEAEGVEFRPGEGKLTYFGEAKTKENFKQLLNVDDEAISKFSEKAIDQLADALARAKKDKGGAKLDRDVRDKVKGKMCEKYDDIRLFGAVLTAGTNAGQVRGPMQLTFARSIKPIFQQDAAITRVAITKESDLARKQTEFGRKPWLNYAAYRQYGFFNASLAQQSGTGVTRDDLARFWEATACMFPNAASASKGLMATRDIVVFVHPNSRGVAPSHKLFERTNVVEEDGAAVSLTVQEEARLGDMGIGVHRPLKDMWPSL